MLVNLQFKDRSAVLDTLGGELVSYKDENATEYIWQGDSGIWSGKNPLLFPIVGGLKDGKVQISGKEYEMPKHGFARRTEFAVAEQGEHYAVFELCDSDKTREQYPFAFKLRVRHEMLEDGFKTSFTVKNTGDADMTYFIGAHTGFNCPLYKGERFEDYAIRFAENETAKSRVIAANGCIDESETLACLDKSGALPLRHDIFDKVDTLIFDTLKKPAATLINPATGKGLRMEFDGFPMLGIWTAPNKNGDYICIEPWHGCSAITDETGRLEDKPHCIMLKPGDSFELGYKVVTIN